MHRVQSSTSISFIIYLGAFHLVVNFKDEPPIKVELTDEQQAALPANSRWSTSQGHYIVKAGNQVFGAWWDETAKRWYSQREGKPLHWRVKQEGDIDEPAPPTPTQSTAPLPGPSTSTGQMTAPPIAPSLSFTELQESALLILTDEEEEDEEEGHKMSLSKEAMTDLATAVVLALQAAGEGAYQGSKVSKKVHVAKPRDFDGEHDYVDFKRELRLYIYASESEFRTNKSKIMFTLSYMKSGAAAHWAESYTSGAVDEDGDLKFTDSWDAFLKKLDTSFDDPARSQKAFERLDAMYQGDLNANEFFNKFDICRVDAGLATEAHDEWLISHLKRALNPKVVEGVMRLPNEPMSYDEFKKAAVKVDRVEHQIRDLMAERRRKE
ncbi:hypothetical protein ACEPAF_8562 [Sanghuangporus sanghuang]